MNATLSIDNLRPWKQFICRACGLIYDEQQGDPDSGLAAGTRFEDIPDDWACPLCGVIKSDFEPWEPLVRPTGTSIQQGAVLAAQRLNRKAGIVIIGAGIAGWAAAEVIRALDNDVPITMVTACRGDRYHKPELSVAYSRKSTIADLVREHSQSAADRLSIRLLNETFVVGIASARHQVRTTKGTLTYRSLVIAQGAKPALPPNLPADLCWRVNEIDGWNGISNRLGSTPKKIAIIGAGMIGCELAEDFARAGHQVVLLDTMKQPLSALLPPQAADRLRTNLEKIGVGFLGGVRVKKICLLPDQKKLLEIEEHISLVVDEVVAATGLKTETRLARSAQLSFDAGIVVDTATLRTSVNDIYALGDCISIDGLPCRFIEPIGKQAAALAHALLQRDHAGYQHRPPVIRLKTRSEAVVIHGLPNTTGEWRVTHQSDNGLQLQQWENGQSRAQVDIGNVSRAAA